MMELDDKIWEKNFDELTSKEKQFYAELFEDEAAFEQIKLTMKQINAMDKSEIIQPQPELKEELMASFQAKWREKPLPWYKKIWIFLLNPGKPIFYKPAFQIGLSIAMVVLLLQIIPLHPQKELLAQNTTKKEENLSKIPTKHSEEVPLKKLEKTIAPNSMTRQESKEQARLSNNDDLEISTEAIAVQSESVPSALDFVVEDSEAILKEKTAKFEGNAILDVPASTTSYSRRVSTLNRKKSEQENTNNIQFTNDETILLGMLETAY